jgi:hypothetical protein
MQVLVRPPLTFSVVILLLGSACGAKYGEEQGGSTSSGGSSGSSSGVVITDNVAITPAKLSLTTRCGASASAPISLANNGSAPIEYEVQVPEGLPLTLDNGQRATKATLSPGAVATISVTLNATLPSEIEHRVLVTIGGKTTVIAVGAKVSGALLTLSPSLVDFGEVRQNTNTPPQPIEITNTGTESGVVAGWKAVAATDDFKMSTASLTILPGQKASATVTFNAGPAGAALGAEYEPTSIEPLCELPKLRIKGQRVNTNVTVSPVSADFGGIDCNASPTTVKRITVTNFATQAASVILTLAKGATSPFRLNQAAFTVPAAAGPTGKAELNFDISPVSPISANPGPIADSVKVDITGPEPSSKVINVTATVQGAVLEATPLTLTGFAAATTVRSFTIRNLGNKQITLAHASSTTSEFQITNGTATSTLPPNGPFNSANVDVKLMNLMPGIHNANITTTRTTPVFGESGQLCRPAPVVAASATL